MQENFEHFNWEDLFKDSSSQPEANTFKLPEITILTDTKCSTTNLKILSAAPEKALAAYTSTRGQTRTYGSIHPGTQREFHEDIQQNLNEREQTKTDTTAATTTMISHHDSLSSDLADIINDETFFDDVINVTGGLTSFHGDGEMWKEEEESVVWEGVSAIFQDGGHLHGVKMEEEDSGERGGMFLNEESENVEEFTLINLPTDLLNHNNEQNNIIFSNITPNNDVTNNNAGEDNDNKNAVGSIENFPYVWNVDGELFQIVDNAPTTSTMMNPTSFQRKNNFNDINLFINKTCNDRNNGDDDDDNNNGGNDTNREVKKELKRKIKFKMQRVDDGDDEEEDEQKKLEYLKKRSKNNQSVRKSREKSRKRQEEVEWRAKKLEDENDGLKRKVNEMEKEVEILKRLLTEVVRK